MTVELDPALAPVVEKMRTDFVLVAGRRVQAGAWDAGDRAKASAAIKHCVAAADAGAVLSWARWLADMSALELSDWSTPSPTMGRDCSDCGHYRQPNRSEGQCGGRDDLVRLYGPDNPLSVLPADGAASCPKYVSRRAS